MYGQVCSLSHNSITDILQIETLFSDITHKLNSFSNERYPHHISMQKNISMKPYIIFLIVMNAHLIILMLCQDNNLFLDNYRTLIFLRREEDIMLILKSWIYKLI